jgi:peroxiredoxin
MNPLTMIMTAAIAASALSNPAADGMSIGKTVGDFTAPDHKGGVHRLSDWHDQKVVVIAFLSMECPLAKLYGPRLARLAAEYNHHRVAFIAVTANQQQLLEKIDSFVRETGIQFPVLLDETSRLAEEFGARRSPEVFVLDQKRRLRYRGRIDDQYAPGQKRASATHCFLADAIAAILDGNEVAVPVTEPTGCLLHRLPRPGRHEVTYHREVAPLLEKHCVACHRPGEVGPFSLTGYQDAANWAEMIAEVVENGRMPPWHANPKYGRFANDPRLSAEEKRVITTWVREGLAEGTAPTLQSPAKFAPGWSIGQPDAVLRIPEPIAIPAQGVMEYQIIDVDPKFHEDKWVRAVEVRPGNRAVVHHCNVFLKPPGGDGAVEGGSLGSYCLAAMAPGTPPLALPEGMAKVIPAGWHLQFVLHYTPVGSPQTDQTSIGLLFADAQSVKQEVATKLLYDPDLLIPPGVPDYQVVRTYEFPEDSLLLAMFPHMHLRGKSFRYEVYYPDGSNEVLLDVPNYDFKWQNRYELAEPKRLPRGAILRCTAHYDNSADNPANPDPSAQVHAGQQSWDEMFNGYFEIARADEGLTKPTARGALGEGIRLMFSVPALLTWIATGAGFLVFNRVRRPRAR